MANIRLVHWNAQEAAERAERLTTLGHTVEAGPIDSAGLRAMRGNPPDAIVIDLSRLPSHGREIGSFVRQRKPTRLVPLIFVEGEPAKVERVQELLPDARYTTYDRIGPVLDDVLLHPAREVVVPKSLATSNTPTPLVKKLGIKPGQPVVLVNAPRGSESLLQGIKCLRRIPAEPAMLLWFVRSQKELHSNLAEIYEFSSTCAIWIIWPKQSSGLGSDLGDRPVRKICLSVGLVDFKICAVDDIWSGMRFARKRTG